MLNKINKRYETRCNNKASNQLEQNKQTKNLRFVSDIDNEYKLGKILHKYESDHTRIAKKLKSKELFAIKIIRKDKI